jgi:hypothetical protein
MVGSFEQHAGDALAEIPADPLGDIANLKTSERMTGLRRLFWP